MYVCVCVCVCVCVHLHVWMYGGIVYVWTSGVEACGVIVCMYSVRVDQWCVHV